MDHPLPDGTLAVAIHRRWGHSGDDPFEATDLPDQGRAPGTECVSPASVRFKVSK